MQYFEYLSEKNIAYVHHASLEVLAETGLQVRNEKARRRFAEQGATVDHETEMVYIPCDVVEKYRKMAPPTITLRGRDPACDVTFPRELPVIATASSAPDIVDPVTGITRRATSDDIARIAGHDTARIPQVLGYSNGDEVIHRDDLVVLRDETTP